ncbi:MAG: hypothetical protein JWP97_3217 [Labilithrix sp.]|nr:hypothetical protein [Labilithrix sp.]
MRTKGSRVSALAVLVALAAASTAACKHDAAPASITTVTAAPAVIDADNPVPEISASAKLAAVALSAVVHAAPNEASKKLGYLRLGSVVARSDKPYGTDGCPGGWYGVAPRGFVCIGKYASLETDTPLLRAASVRPDTSQPLPYAYGFVRAVAPLYLRVPTKEEMLATEFKLEPHLSWWNRKGHAANRIHQLGANDLAHEIIQDARTPQPSNAVDGVLLLGGHTEQDPVPFWLEGGARGIPNVSAFDVPARAVFANRVHRHTGIAFIGAFASGPAPDDRQYAVTVDMRLVPVDKLKPEVGSAFHGVELKDGELGLPLAFARPCNPSAKGTPKPCVHVFRGEGEGMTRTDELLPTRGMLALTGQQKRIKDTRFLETKAGTWLRASDVGVAAKPDEWPQAAQRGDRWIDVSIDGQTLVLFEGKKPVYATVVSTGQDGLDDPKTTKATPRGTFRVKSKHITTTMDSNGRSAQSGGAAPESGESSSPTEDDKHAGSFELRDVPYVQYFHEGYALHSAYWHDHFGLPRSHGCINLAPIDALRVFRFTDPPVPEGWHGTNAEPGKGSVIVVRR